ncbi:Vacuolar protein sorting-associated protein 51 [Phlyctochytrium planicorne]|nr:Vacuolar protein sorting-associated protein 51 [Phlyctochytrium planicorne]
MATPTSPIRSPSVAASSPMASVSSAGRSSPVPLAEGSPSSMSKSPSRSIGDDSTLPNSPPRPRRAARNLLKNYYGISEDAASSQDMENTSNIKPWGADPMDMDNEAFISETFIKNSLYEKNLAELIKTDTELIAEIKEIDGHMKTLVYQNYHKFIAAIDTIKDTLQMKHKVEDMNGEMEELERNMNMIMNVNRNVNEKLNPNRTKLQKLHNIHGLLRKLNFVFELPSKLETAFNSGHFKQAVKYHMATSALLQHYYHIPVFKKIDEECKEITVKVGVKVRDKMKNPQSSISDIRESVGLLLGLNMQFPVELARDYMKTIKEKMALILQEASKEIDKEIKITEARSGEALGSLITKVRAFITQVLSPFADLIDAFDEYFLSDAKTVIQTSYPKNADNPLNPKLNIKAKFTPEQRQETRNELFALTDEILQAVFSRVNKLMSIPVRLLQYFADVWNLNSLQAVQILDCMSDEGCKFRSLREVVDMDDRVRNLVLDFFKNLLDVVFTRTRKDFFNELKDTIKVSIVERKAAGTRIVASFVSNLTQKAFGLIASFIKPDLHYFSTSCISLEEFLSLITDNLEELWLSLKADFTSYYELQHDQYWAPPPSVIILTLAKSADELASTHMESIFASFYETVLGQQTKETSSPTKSQAKAMLENRKNLHIVTASGASVPSNISSGQSGRKDPGDSKPKVDLQAKHREVIQQWKDFAKLISFAYTFQISSRFVRSIKDYIRDNDWNTNEEPKRPGEALESMINFFSSGVESEVSTVFTDEAVDQKEREKTFEAKRRLSAVPSRSNSMHIGTPPPGASNSALQRTGSNAPIVLPRSSSFRNASAVTNANQQQSGGLLSSNMFSMKRGPSSLSDRNNTAQSLQHSRSSSISASGTLGLGGPVNPKSKFDAMLDNIGRLFNEKVDLFGPVPVSRCGILNAVARILIKAYAEEIKVKILSREGFHQVQVDAEYLRIFLVKPAFCTSDDEGIFAGLAEDIVAAALRRCLEPIPFEDSELSRAVHWKSLDLDDGTGLTLSVTKTLANASMVKSPIRGFGTEEDEAETADDGGFVIE